MSKARSAGYTPAQERELRAARLSNEAEKRTAKQDHEDHDRVIDPYGRHLYGMQRNLYADTGDWS